jgi:CheY-like chemotaxis protein
MIFIVDDSPTDIELTTIALEATGREIVVRFATDGKSALAMLRNGLRVPALILLDLKMPGMDGIEVLREIRADDRLRDLPVVVVTSSALELDRADAFAAGASGYIQKPLALDQFGKDLESVVQRWLPN